MMIRIIALLLLLCAAAGCTKDKCYIVLDANNKELCAKCFHTVDERDTWARANQSKTPQEQCR